MIGYLEGTILFCDGDTAIILVGGVGYRVGILKRDGALQEGERCAFHIASYYRDGALELYGFRDREDLIMFERLISVSGVGPKSAIAVLHMADAGEIRNAIRNGDPDLLKKVSGIGTKTAERIVVELKNAFRGSDEPGNIRNGEQDDLAEALVRLGYSRQAARDALISVPDTALTPEEKIRMALKYLS